ncbi:hypothetical protein KFL_006560090 [Klebsormidium nitens]|uniref:Vacuolar ATPase assembly integral membrane protein VMA21 homolog n=1 Tax=Klebsormidium nitens TaxID=105231 RepID=A0A1Y1IID7_KLENI|nr:hypothetical protein KFL_006560090 [Klebsormidium nitens]|eukprot:GAQ90564.1 hypothetical protein KFL_006560090 [Klebsormidium nitens]
MAAANTISKFAITSLLMWVFPLLIIHAFYNNTFNVWELSIIRSLSPEHRTILMGLLAVLSVNLVIAIYIYLALKEPRTAAEPQPDPAFAEGARKSVEGTAPRKRAPKAD